jgi:hypothetical protein
MKYRIAYCQECGNEYENVMSKYGEKCECGGDLFLAYKFIEKNCKGVRIEHNITMQEAIC